MRYEGILYRPPSEARSLIIQMTIGCARNTCTFCSMYKDKKFRIRPIHEVVSDLEDARLQYGEGIACIFFADGDALAVKTEALLEVLHITKKLFPMAERISMYASPLDILSKTKKELCALRESGLSMLYLGIESGDDTVLQEIKKGVTAKEMIQAGILAQEAGIKISATLILGLGGKERSKEHALASADVVSQIKPAYLGLLTLMIEKGTPMYGEVQAGRRQVLTPEEILEETKVFLTEVDSERTIFRANHASNYAVLKGVLNQDKQRLLTEIETIQKRKSYRPESIRGL